MHLFSACNRRTTNALDDDGNDFVFYPLRFSKKIQLWFVAKILLMLCAKNNWNRFKLVKSYSTLNQWNFFVTRCRIPTAEYRRNAAEAEERSAEHAHTCRPPTSERFPVHQFDGQHRSGEVDSAGNQRVHIDVAAKWTDVESQRKVHQTVGEPVRLSHSSSHKDSGSTITGKTQTEQVSK